MPGVSLGSLLAAAIVSAAVALGVEWLAKPRLEARKERILGRYRARDHVWHALHSILLAAATMKNTQAQLEDIQAAGAGVVPATRALEEAFREVMPFTRMRDIGLMASYVGMVRGAMKSNRTWPEKGELLFASTPGVACRMGPRWPKEPALRWLARTLWGSGLRGPGRNPTGEEAFPCLNDGASCARYTHIRAGCPEPARRASGLAARRTLLTNEPTQSRFWLDGSAAGLPPSPAAKTAAGWSQSQMHYGREDQRQVQQDVDDFTAECRKVLHPAEVGRPAGWRPPGRRGAVRAAPLKTAS
jgi:hypothetical protein